MQKLISFDLKANMGFLKKPDINEGGGKQLYLTFNMLHKPALLGILGAIVGLKGYCVVGELPNYYIELKDLSVGIQPLKSEKGDFQKTIVQYNNSVGYANLDGNLIIAEQVLIKPSFRCYLLLEDNPLHFKIDNYLQNIQAEYLPYLGKNEFSLWWENYREYAYQPFTFDRNYKIATIFNKADKLVKEMREKTSTFLFENPPEEPEFIYFEELPVGLDERLLQYKKELFAFTNFTLKKEKRVDGLYRLSQEDVIIQLF